MVQFCLSRGADPNGGNDVNNPIYRASTKGHTEVVRLLLQHGANVKGKRFKHSANQCCNNALSLQRGADPNGGSGDYHPIHRASREGQTKVVQLLQCNADTQSGDTSPLFGAARGGHVDVVRLLLHHGLQVDGLPQCSHRRRPAIPISAALSSNRAAVVQLLLDFGAATMGLSPGRQKMLQAMISAGKVSMPQPA